MDGAGASPSLPRGNSSGHPQLRRLLSKVAAAEQVTYTVPTYTHAKKRPEGDGGMSKEEERGYDSSPLTHT